MIKPMICTVCGSQRVANILYGMPAYSEDLINELKTGKWILGGCCVGPDMPETICLDCNPESTDSYYQKELDKRPGVVA
jgi:hypothetical protein